MDSGKWNSASRERTAEDFNRVFILVVESMMGDKDICMIVEPINTLNRDTFVVLQ